MDSDQSRHDTPSIYALIDSCQLMSASLNGFWKRSKFKDERASGKVLIETRKA
jgi:hypothetical protein